VSTMAPEVQKEVSQDRDEHAWERKLRDAIRSGNFDVVARSIHAMGRTNYVDAIHGLLLEEVKAVPRREAVERFDRLLRALRTNDVAPFHAVQLWRVAEKWFRRKPVKREKWNTIIYALVRAGELDDALEYVRLMELQERGSNLPSPNQATYTALIPAVTEEGGTRAAHSLIARMTQRSLVPDFITYLMMAVVNIRTEPPNVDIAKRWVRKAEACMDKEGQKADRRAVTLYNTLMSGYVKLKLLKDAFSILGCMRRRGIRPDVYSFHILMLACLKQSLYGTQECRQLIHVMEQMGIQPSVANYNTVIRGYASTGQLTSALKLANQMREAGVAWDKYTYLHLIRAVITGDQVVLSLRLLARMRRDGVRPLEVHYTMTFVGLANAGFYDDASRVFRRLISMGDLASPWAYNLMIHINSQRGDMEGALEVRNMMEAAGFPPDIGTFRALLEGFVQCQEFASALELLEPIGELRNGLLMTLKDPVATHQAVAQARQALYHPTEVQNWEAAYDYLLDAAKFSNERGMAVAIVEEMVKFDLQIHPRWQDLLAEANVSKSVADVGLPAKTLSPLTGAALEEAEMMREAQAKWVQQVPGLQELNLDEAVAGPPPLSSLRAGAAGGKQSGEQSDEAAPKPVPAQFLSASFSPDWLGGGSWPQDLKSTSAKALLESCLKGGDISSETAYRAVHDFHHATAHRRGLTALHLPAGRVVVGRRFPETMESLRQLFTTFGEPGNPGTPIYIFLRPDTANLEALLTLLLAGAAYPGEVFLLRAASASSAFKTLGEQCKARGDKSLRNAVFSTLVQLPSALLLNSETLVTNVTKVTTVMPDDFEASVRRAIGSAPAAVDRGDTTALGSSWAQWLKRQQLRQLIRCNDDTIRLDGITHNPALSRSDLFRIRSVDGRRTAVEMWLDDAGAVVEIGLDVPL